MILLILYKIENRTSKSFLRLFCNVGADDDGPKTHFTCPHHLLGIKNVCEFMIFLFHFFFSLYFYMLFSFSSFFTYKFTEEKSKKRIKKKTEIGRSLHKARIISYI